MTAAIELTNVQKRFGDVAALADVSFSVAPKEIFGFMGHNGAGKTTALRVLLGLLRVDSGRATVLGHDVAKDPIAVRRVCGYLPADYALPPDMTPLELLDYVGAMFGLSRHEAHERGARLLSELGLEAAKNRKLRGFSTGMTQKVGLAQALINEPRVLLLDEPTAGLDPLGRHELLERLRALAASGVTVLFSTHILSDVEALCQRIAVLHQGRVLAVGGLAELKEQHGAHTMDDLYLTLVRGQSR